MKLPTRMNIAIGALVALCVTQTDQLFFIAGNLAESEWDESHSASLFLKGILVVGNALMFSTDKDGVVNYSEWFTESDDAQKVQPAQCESAAQRLASGSWNSAFAAEPDTCEHDLYRDSSGWHYSRVVHKPITSTRFKPHMFDRTCPIKRKEYQ